MLLSATLQVHKVDQLRDEDFIWVDFATVQNFTPVSFEVC